jgi:hypothetical protein
LQFFADNDGAATPNHVNFSLDPAGESIGFFSGAGATRCRDVHLQPSDVSQGRYPDSASGIIALAALPVCHHSRRRHGRRIPDASGNRKWINPNDPNDADLDKTTVSNRAEYLAGTTAERRKPPAAVLVPAPRAGRVAVRSPPSPADLYRPLKRSRRCDRTKLDVPAQGSDTLSTP